MELAGLELGDLLGAIQALSQLSYSPALRRCRVVGDSVAPASLRRMSACKPASVFGAG